MTISCVMPTTSARAWCLPHAVRYWERQIFRSETEPELVIIASGPKPLDHLYPENPRIRYFHMTDEPALSDKYNFCVEVAKHDWIALWADDDWQAPWRLMYTMMRIESRPHTEIAGLRKMIFHRQGTDRSWMYERGDQSPYFLGGSLVFHRRYWERHRFPTGLRSYADADFSNGIPQEEYDRVACVLSDPTFYVAMQHTANTGMFRDDPHGEGWSPFAGIRNVLTRDAAMYSSDPDFDRASGDATCPRCGRKLYDHPAHRGHSWLTVSCTGAVFKL